VPSQSFGSRKSSSLQIFVHCANSVDYLAEHSAWVPGVEHYAERALLLAEHEDVVCLPAEIDSEYIAYLAELGLGPAPQNVLVASRFADGDSERPLWRRILTSDEALGAIGCLITRHRSARIQPFIASRGQFTLAAALEKRTGVPVQVYGGDPAVVAYADCKHHIRAKAMELGIPVAPGEIVDLASSTSRADEATVLRRAMERQIQLTGRVIIRGASGAAGSATYTAEGPGQVDELSTRLPASRDNRIYLVESMVDVDVSPNIQMHIERDLRGIRCGGMTDQRWERPLVHGGNVFPSAARRTAEMLSWARTLAEWLNTAGYVGVSGFDFVEYTDATGEPRAFLAEANPRTNGATYPLRLRRRLNVAQREAGLPEIRAFVTGMIEVEARTFSELRASWNDRLFCPYTGSGLIPYVPGLLPHGKCGIVALAATREEAEMLYREAGAAAIIA
jgi:hypothetical protein